uniref:aspartyl aminopeptidase n=1 Tax=Phaeomonas parva TaxID=124430 RepID=A0A7S1XZN9_9STRA|mmetsp:Transcript_6157/g.17190  ORF Transcript_6157/g.17190 Transcript_6157/m.17190 type:complete len:499 (+) Transcript_6157:100-1596(+)
MADPAFAADMVAYLNEAWTCFHAVEAGKALLFEHGFVELDEAESWGSLEKNGKYFFTRNMSSLVAFTVGGAADPGCGVTLVGAHTDSPCPKLKPVSRCTRGACSMVGVCGYGGGQWHTWFDRDLTVAGRVLIRGADGGLVHRLVKIARPILRTSTLAIHLSKGNERSAFEPNLQAHFYPILATAIKEAALLKAKGGAGAGGKSKPSHSPLLLGLLADELGCAETDILDFDLQLCDTQPSAIGGAANEFIFSGRLDNLCSSYQGLRALVDTLDSLGTDKGVRLVALFDHEEVGSSSSTGAGGPILPNSIARITQGMYGDSPLCADVLPRVYRKSFCVSADMAHAQHPNYPERHDPNLNPSIHSGVVIKHNANQRYATSAVTATLFRECCAKGGVPVQEFAVRSDSGCGSTIGPITASLTGIRTVDIGSPQLSMHSIREIMGTDDAYYGYAAIKACFENFNEIDEGLTVDAGRGLTVDAGPAPSSERKRARGEPEAMGYG